MAHDHDVAMLAAESAVQRRDREALPRLAARLEELANRDGHRLYLAIAHRAWGVAHLLDGYLDKSRTRLQESLEIFAALETRWQAGRTFFELGELARARGDQESARASFSQALAAFETLQARPDAERARRGLDEQGWLPSGPSGPSMN
jgi:tetratricopeptide (TPR) repeat protein